MKLSTQRVDNPMFYFQQKKREKRNRKDNDMAVARYTLAVNRRYKRDGEQEADFGWVYYIKSVNAQKIVMGLEVKIN